MRDNKGKFLKQYEIDETFFRSVETEEQAYILGFLYADGCNQIYNTQRYISACQLEQDKDILDKIKAAMSYSNPNYVIETQKSNGKVKYKLQIYSEVISEDLENLGMLPNKSLSLQFPTFISDPLIPHFIRGYFDGDGCVWEGKPRIDSKNKFIHNVKFTITGNFDFIDKLQDILVQCLGFRKTKLNFSKAKNSNNNTSEHVCTMEYSGKKQMKIFYDYLYKEATIFGNRKKEKFESIICANSKKLLFETRLIAGTPEMVISSQASNEEGSTTNS